MSIARHAPPAGSAEIYRLASPGDPPALILPIRNGLLLGLTLDDSDRLAAELLLIVKANEGFSWVSCGDEAGAFTGAYRPAEGGVRINQCGIEGGKTRPVEYAVAPDGARRIVRSDDDSGYDPRDRPFYRKPKQHGPLVWLPPYVFYNRAWPAYRVQRPAATSVCAASWASISI
jgi:hypothetical protein